MGLGAFLEKSSRQYGFFYGLQETADVAAHLDAAGDDTGAWALTAAEYGVFVRLTLKKRKIEWLSGRMACKRAFAQFAATLDQASPPSEISVLNDRDHAPFIVEYPELRVSISHSHAYAVAVVAPFNVGIDIEKIEHRPSALTDYFCCRDERVFLEIACRSAAQKDGMITRLWSRKEALAKYLRLGGRLNFGQINTIQDCVCGEGISRDEIRLVSKSCDGYAISLALPASDAILKGERRQ